jgi:hypothetical protein
MISALYELNLMFKKALNSLTSLDQLHKAWVLDEPDYPTNAIFK